MHSSTPHRLGRRALPAFCFLLAVGTLAAAGSDAVADISITPGQVSWSPNVRAEKWTLTVSGQGIYLREVVEKGEPLRLQATAPDGERLADGSYNWELRAVNPEIQQGGQMRRPPIRQRQVERTETERGHFERRYVRRPVVTSGSFKVQNGGFVMPQPEMGESGSGR